jgi:hypothetical protein
MATWAPCWLLLAGMCDAPSGRMEVTTEEEAVAAEARISDALLMDSTLSGLPLTPTAHVPLWSGTPLTLEIRGAVPRSELREAAVDVARREMARNRPDFRFEDHIAVDPAAFSHAA